MSRLDEPSGHCPSNTIPNKEHLVFRTNNTNYSEQYYSELPTRSFQPSSSRSAVEATLGFCQQTRSASSLVGAKRVQRATGRQKQRHCGLEYGKFRGKESQTEETGTEIAVLSCYFSTSLLSCYFSTSFAF